jgi:hypothetical protein
MPWAGLPFLAAVWAWCFSIGNWATCAFLEHGVLKKYAQRVSARAVTLFLKLRLF